MSTFYVATNGNDNSSSGDLTHPYLTLFRGIDQLVAGDTLFIRAGTYAESIDSNDFSGTTFPAGTSYSNPVLIAGYPGETAIITGGVNLPAAHIQYVILQNLTIDGTDVHDSGISIPSGGAHHCRVQNCEIRNSGVGFPLQAEGSNFANIIIGGNFIEFIDNYIHSAQYSYGFYWAGDDGLIESNEITNNGGYGIQNYNGSGTSQRLVIRGNRIWDNGFRNVFGGNSGIVIANAANALCTNNLIYDNGGEAGVMIRSTSNIRVFNNTIWSNDGHGILFTSAASGGFARNNIIYQNGGNTIEDQGTSNTKDTNLFTDPSFVDSGNENFHLASGSAARNTGATIAQVTNDYDGVPRPQESVYCLGAYEFLPADSAVVLQVSPSRVGTKAATPATANLAGGLVAPATLGVARPRISRAKPSLGATLNRQHPLAENLVACWILNEQHGHRLYDLVQDREIRFDQRHFEWRSGNFYSAGIRGRIGPWALAANVVPTFTLSWPWTWETWVNVSQTQSPGTSEGLLLSDAPSNHSLAFNVSPVTTWKFDYFYDGTNFSAQLYPFNTWHHVVLAATSATTAVLYVNGRVDTTFTVPSTTFPVVYVGGSDIDVESFTGGVDVLRFWQGRALNIKDVQHLYTNPWSMIDPLRKRLIIMAGNRTIAAVVRVTPSRVGTQASTTPVSSPAVQGLPARVAVAVATPRMDRRFTVQPARVATVPVTLGYTIGVVIPPINTTYAAALAQTFVAGDWLVEIPALDLFLAFQYAPDATWDHRLLDIGDIEVAVSPGGGMSTVNNVTLRIAETGDTTSIVERWEARGTLAGVQVTISFLLQGQTTALQIYSGVIDSVTVSDAVTQILVVDESIQRNVQIPRVLIDQNTFPASDTSLWTKPEPLVYGKGSHGGALPLLHVDTLRRTYLLAAHPVVIAGNLAVFHADTSTFMALGDVSQLYTQITSTLTLVTLARSVQELRFNVHSGGLRLLASAFVTNARQAIDSNTTTLALVTTSGVDSNLDGYGELVVAGSATPTQRGNNTVVFQVFNHRRAAASEATVSGTFSLRTVDAITGATLRDNLFQTQAYRHALTAQTTSFVVPSLNLGTTENVAVRILARKEGGAGTAASNYYEIGEIHLDSFYQPTTDSAVYVQGTGWQGRTDPDGTITAYYTTGGTGTLLTFPDEVLASMLQQEMRLTIDVPTFAQAHSTYAALTYQLDGGVGAGWAVERQAAREMLHELARQSFSILAPSTSLTWLLKPYDSARLVAQAFDVSTILTAEGTTQPGQPGWRSSFQMTLGNLAQVHHHFEVHYAYNVATNKYDKIARVDENDSSLAAAIVDKEAMELACQASFALYGLLDPFILPAHWIYDDVTAALLLRHYVLYFYAQRLSVAFDSTLRGLTLALGDFITVDYPALPASEQGATFEVHRLQYHPTAGRVSLAASRLVALSAEYFAIKDQTAVTWYFWTDRAGQLVRDLTAPVIAPFTMVSLVPSPVPFYLRTLDEVGGTWYLYPDTLGELLISSAAPPIGSGVNVGTGQTWQGHTQHTYRLGAQSWGAWTIVQLD